MGERASLLDWGRRRRWVDGVRRRWEMEMGDGRRDKPG